MCSGRSPCPDPVAPQLAPTGSGAAITALVQPGAQGLGALSERPQQTLAPTSTDRLREALCYSFLDKLRSRLLDLPPNMSASHCRRWLHGRGV